MAKHGIDSQESTYRYIQSLKQQPDILAEIKAGLTELARQADQDQPVGSALAREIEAAAAAVGAVHRQSEDWFGMCRTDPRNRRDQERVEDPRKSGRVERNADVGAAIRDA